MIHGRIPPMKSAKTYKKKDVITLAQGKTESCNRKERFGIENAEQRVGFAEGGVGWQTC